MLLNTTYPQYKDQSPLLKLKLSQISKVQKTSSLHTLSFAMIGSTRGQSHAFTIATSIAVDQYTPCTYIPMSPLHLHKSGLKLRPDHFISWLLQNPPLQTAFPLHFPFSIQDISNKLIHLWLILHWALKFVVFFFFFLFALIIILEDLAQLYLTAPKELTMFCSANNFITCSP